jgi:hypothetical protein
MCNYKLILGCVEHEIEKLGKHNVAFIDPPDNIGLRYQTYRDKLSNPDYTCWLETVLSQACIVCDLVWCSFNSKWIFDVGGIVNNIEVNFPRITSKLFIQHFTFGQHNKNDLGNNYRPLLRFRHENAPLYPDAIRVASQRQIIGDKRANPNGRVPGDVLDFPRVTGNSSQRRKWHPTQLNEGLVEFCLKFTCKVGDSVLDLCSGTGTTLRVCKRLGLNCTSIEFDPDYCHNIAQDNGLRQVGEYEWVG